MVDIEKIAENKEDIGYLIWKILKFWQRGKHRVLEDYGITGSQMEILGSIYKNKKNGKDEVTQVFLSQDTDIDPMTVSTILRNLQKKGLITRKESKTDTRARVVELTGEGTKLLTKAIKRVTEENDYLFRNVDKDSLRSQLLILLGELRNRR